MKAVSKSVAKRMDQLVLEITAASEAASDAYRTMEEAIKELVAPYRTAVQAYNELITEWNETIDEVHGDISEFVGERSEKWTESDAGSRYADWLDAVDQSRLDEAEEPEDPDLQEVEFTVPDLPPLSISELE